MQEGLSQVKPTHIYSNKSFKDWPLRWQTLSCRGFHCSPDFCLLPLSQQFNSSFCPVRTASYKKLYCSSMHGTCWSFWGNRHYVFSRLTVSMGIKEKISLLAYKARVRELLIGYKILNYLLRLFF